MEAFYVDVDITLQPEEESDTEDGWCHTLILCHISYTME